MKTLLCLILLMGVTSMTQGETKFGAPFSDHAVLQRGRPLVVWGTDEPGREVQVAVGTARKMVVTQEKGEWSATFGPLAAGGPITVTATGSTTATLSNVLIGDVWLCGGQSNMEWPLNLCDGGVEAIAKAGDFPTIRLLRMPHLESAEEQRAFPTPVSWQIASPESAKDFSGVGWFFGRRISTEVGVPVGLVQVAWGGTRIEPWIGAPGFAKAPALRDIHRRQMAQIRQLPSEMQRWELREAEWKASAVHADPGRDPITEGWESPDASADGWDTVGVPFRWQDGGHAMNGAAWFRLTVDIPETWQNADLELNLGPIDDLDDTWFNGVRIGGMNDPANELSWAVKRRYRIPASALRPGQRNTVAIRVWDKTGDGGIMGAAGDYFVRHPLTERTLPLDPTGFFRVEKAIPLPTMNYFEFAARYRPRFADPATHPSRLYNGMISPLTPMAVCGAIWYQGESNADGAQDYTRLLPALIANWRQAFRNNDMPFYFVQLANFGSRELQGGRSKWAELREAQRSALSIPGTGMVVTIDVGNPFDIHPRDKQTVGERLADQALAKHYGQELNGGIYEGPLAVGARRQVDGVHVWFTSIGGGLQLKDGDPRAFEVAGSDGVFRPATARISGETVVVSSPEVRQISTVRYGWADSPDACLFNAEGYPASPFRLDVMKD
ncbi:hypothetical protein GC173_17240 [bacterium]|nr:hypothetical protein [bacterium]